MPDGVPANVPVPLANARDFPRPFGRYILEKALSRGGMGEVFLALPRGVQSRCVIKTIRGDLTGDKEFIGRFADEAKIMTRINHSNIIRVFDCGRVGTDYYIAMEFVYGRDMGDVLDRAYERGEPLPPSLGLFLTKQILAGLHYAHNITDEAGRPMRLVHRDISPQNVLIGFDGSVKIIDFGLARTELLPARTQGALAVGKYGYMSPEQARHEKIDGRADLYSTGVMLFEVFTGDRLVDEQDQATLWARVLNPKHRKASTVIPGLPSEIDELISTAVASKPDDRFPDAMAMLRYVDGMKTKPARREELVEYLRYLYPNVDFKQPPLPELRDGQLISSEKSMIIAMSAEVAKSVFGRGEMPVEWTMQVNVADLRAEYAAKQRRGESQDPVTKPGHLPPAPSSKVVVTDPSTDEMRGRGFGGSGAEEPPTRVSDSAMPMGTLSDQDQTKYERPPRSDDRIPAAKGGKPSASFRDDEMTVMMEAPPRGLANWTGDEMTSDEILAPTKASSSPTPAGGTAPVSLNPGRRAIQEKQAPAKEKARPAAAPAKDHIPNANPVALRNTVKQVGAKEEVLKVDQIRNEVAKADPASRRVDPAAQTAITKPQNNFLLLGLIMVATAFVIFLFVLLIKSFK